MTWHYFTNDDWRRFRMNGIGGSEAPTIMGCSPRQSLYALALRKRGLAPEPDENAAMAWGKRLERSVVEAWEEETGSKTDYSRWAVEARVLPTGSAKRIAVSEIHPFMFCTPDAMIVNHTGRTTPGVLECKTTWHRIDKLDDPTHPLRREYDAQLRHNMICTGSLWGVLAVLSNGSHFGWYEIEHDEAEAQRIIASEQAFWVMIQAGAMPEVDDSASTEDALKKAYPREDHNAVALPADALADVEQWRINVQLSDEAEKRARLAENRIRARMGAASHGVLTNGTRLTLKKPTRMRAPCRRRRSAR
jgi:putative phage-type endonuclease